MLSEQVKTDIRRHLKQRILGTGYRGTLAPAYLIMPNMNLETRLNTLRPSEESVLTGRAYGSIQVFAPMVAGAVITATFTAAALTSPVAISATVQAGDTPSDVCGRLASAANASSDLITAGFKGQAPWNDNPAAADTVPNPEVQFTAPDVFTMTVATTGTVGAVAVNTGERTDLNIVIAKRPLTQKFGYVPICNYLEGAIGGATRNLDISKAESAVFRQDEVEARRDLYDYYVNQMADFLGPEVLANNLGGPQAYL